MEFEVKAGFASVEAGDGAMQSQAMTPYLSQDWLKDR
jgi:hypothetical protein